MKVLSFTSRAAQLFRDSSIRKSKICGLTSSINSGEEIRDAHRPYPICCQIVCRSKMLRATGHARMVSIARQTETETETETESGDGNEDVEVDGDGKKDGEKGGDKDVDGRCASTIF